MDSACILACDIEKVCSQYDENLFADHGLGLGLRSGLELGLGLGLELGLGLGSYK